MDSAFYSLDRLLVLSTGQQCLIELLFAAPRPGNRLVRGCIPVEQDALADVVAALLVLIAVYSRPLLPTPHTQG